MANTSQWMPYESVAPILLQNNEFPEHPFLSGTGFFVVFPPYDYVFFVTARHCLLDNTGEQLGELKIPWKSSEGCEEAIRFSYRLTGATDVSGEFEEDICVFVVGDMSREKMLHIASKSIKLQNQDNVDLILDYINAHRENLRIVGFPGCSKEIIYEDRKLVATPRGIYGKMTSDSLKRDGYEVSELNWKEGGLSGFSGSPVLSLHATPSGAVVPIVVGVVVTGSPEKFRAVNINVATSLIAFWIASKNGIEVGGGVEVD